MTVAEEKDIPAIGSLLVGMHHNTPMKLPPISPYKVEKALKACMDHGRIFLGHRGDRLVGILALQEGEHWYSHGKFLGDLVFYVEESARTPWMAPRLLRSGMEYAKMRGLPLLMAVVHGEDVVRKDNFYQRHGFERVGGVYSRGF